MGYHVFEREQVLELPLDDVFKFVSSAQNLARITPSSLEIRFEGEPPAELSVGAEIRYRLKISGVPVKWTTRITEWDPPYRFADLQARGPYAYWLHTHSFAALDEGRTLMRDRVIYRVPYGVLGEVARRAFVRAQLRHIFAYRELAFDAVLRGEDPPPPAPARVPGKALAALAAAAAAALVVARSRRGSRLRPGR